MAEGDGGDSAPGRLACRCGHYRSVHEHYRSGTECGICGPAACPRFRPPLRARLGGLRTLLRRRGRPPAASSR